MPSTKSIIDVFNYLFQNSFLDIKKYFLVEIGGKI